MSILGIGDGTLIKSVHACDACCVRVRVRAPANGGLAWQHVHARVDTHVYTHVLAHAFARACADIYAHVHAHVYAPFPQTRARG